MLPSNNVVKFFLNDGFFGSEVVTSIVVDLEIEKNNE